MPNRPATISIKDLANAVEHAVRVTSEKHKVQFSSHFHIGPGTIIGRKLVQPDIGLKQALQIATEITQQVTRGEGSAPAFASAQFEPAVLARGEDGNPTCGMIPCSRGWELE
jgi:hypothetical protein